MQRDVTTPRALREEPQRIARPEDLQGCRERATVALATPDGKATLPAHEPTEEEHVEGLDLRHEADADPERELDDRRVLPVGVVRDDDVPEAPRDPFAAHETPAGQQAAGEPDPRGATDPHPPPRPRPPAR